jgi:hypothetical protein
MAFDLIKLLTDVFDPKAGEVVTVACDLPRSAEEDTFAWRERRQMALEWHRAFAALGRGRSFTTNPLLTYPATGANGADLPSQGQMAGRTVALTETLLASTLAVFLTQYSATAALDGICEHKEDFRAASMPGVERRMEGTGLAADYREVARRCQIIEKILRGATALEVTFSTGNECTFDLRFREPFVDDGILPRFKGGDRVINLPSGETFIVPYEGERPRIPSLTKGVIPLRDKDELVLLQVDVNRIVNVEGSGPMATQLRVVFEEDPARTNIAEVAFGCNDRAQVTGNLLEDEKAGFHWAFGRSEHLGGTVGPEAFAGPDTVVHYDIVYAPGNPIQVAEAVVVKQGKSTVVLRDGAYLVFGKRR